MLDGGLGEAPPVQFLFVAGPDFSVSLTDLETALSSIEAVVDPVRKRAEIAELGEQVAVPDLWSDQENAQRVTSRLSALQSELDRVESLRSRLDDLAILVELRRRRRMPPAWLRRRRS